MKYIFLVCEALYSYGCGVTDLPDLLINYINDAIDNFTMPTDPCLASTVNISWVTESLNLAEQDYGLFSEVISRGPCYIWVDQHVANTIIYPFDKDYLLDYDYWFGDDGECDTVNINTDEWYIVTMPCDKNCTFFYEQS